MLNFSAIYLEQQKSFNLKKIQFKPQSLNRPRQFQQMAFAVPIFSAGYATDVVEQLNLVERFKIWLGHPYMVGIICPLVGLGLRQLPIIFGTNPNPPLMIHRSWQYNLIPSRVQSFHQVLPGMSHEAVKFFLCFSWLVLCHFTNITFSHQNKVLIGILQCHLLLLLKFRL